MQQWLNLFVQFSKPVLTTIIYTGINTWLDVLQEKIQERHRQKAKSFVKALGTKQNHFYQQSINNNFASKTPLDKEIYSPILVEQKNWPLRLSAEKVLEKVGDNNSLIIFLAPPHKTFPEFSDLAINATDFEQKLSQNLREFIEKKYSLYAPNKKIVFLGELWQHSHFYGETSIQLLFEQLQTIPCLILETKIHGQEILFNVVYWQKNARKYNYSTIFNFNYQNFLKESAKTRVSQWKNTRSQLLNLGKTDEDLQRLGGICEQNYALLEELEVLENAGIKIEKLKVSYQFDAEDYELLCQFLSVCHCLIGGWIADIHYLINDNISPHLGTWLLSLGEVFSKFDNQSSILEMTIYLYEDILTVLGQESSEDVPELALKLAESLLNLSDTTCNFEPLIYSFTCWRNKHQLPETPTVEQLKQVRSTLNQKDQNYLSHLKQFLDNLTNHDKLENIREIVDILTSKTANTQLSNPEKFQLQQTVTTVPEKVLFIAWDKKGYELISLKDNHCLKLWYFEPQQESLLLTHQFNDNSGQISVVTTSADRQFLAISQNTNKRSYIKVLRLSTRQVHRTLLGHKKPIYAMAIHLGTHSFIASSCHKIKLWDVQTGKSWLTLFGHKEAVSCLAISRDGQTLMSGSMDTTLRIWNLNQGSLCRTLTGHRGKINTVLLSEDGKTLISGSADKTIKLWDIKTGNLLQSLTGHLGSVSTLCLYHSYLLSGDVTGQIYLWELTTGKLLQTLVAHEQTIQTLSISPDGQRLISGCVGGKVQLWMLPVLTY